MNEQLLSMFLLCLVSLPIGGLDCNRCTKKVEVKCNKARLRPSAISNRCGTRTLSFGLNLHSQFNMDQQQSFRKKITNNKVIAYLINTHGLLYKSMSSSMSLFIYFFFFNSFWFQLDGRALAQKQSKTNKDKIKNQRGSLGTKQFAVICSFKLLYAGDRIVAL